MRISGFVLCFHLPGQPAETSSPFQQQPNPPLRRSHLSFGEAGAPVRKIGISQDRSTTRTSIKTEVLVERRHKLQLNSKMTIRFLEIDDENVAI